MTVMTFLLGNFIRNIMAFSFDSQYFIRWYDSYDIFFLKKTFLIADCCRTNDGGIILRPIGVHDSS